METIFCPVCQQGFNDTQSTPMIFKICGHSICKECFPKIAEKNNFDSVIKIQCPCCRQSQLVDLKKTTLDKEFPKNYLFLHYLNCEKIECEHPLENQNLVCVDSSCKTTKPFCLNCARKTHSNCKNDTVFEKAKFKEIVVFDQCVPFETFNPNKLKKNIENRLNQVKNKLFSVVEEIDTFLKNEISFVKKANECQEIYWENKSLFENKQTQPEKNYP